MASKISNPTVGRFVLPQQRELYLQMREDEKLVPMPVLEQDELESMQYLIRDAAREDYAVTVTWWQPTKGDLGKICSMWGTVKWIDTTARRIKLANDEDWRWIPVDAVVSVRT
ncbi:YolD-like family protein [Brevibacillus agri]|uniref:YolD-like family protein n=1 Tax=Brevibacillus agri TaxID=51101 RepID=UPI001C8E9AD1|nr:YolD-like family protein [Brevibacillus agri]MBY0055002.1 YolD-like family protein [Brevibacillus agri]